MTVRNRNVQIKKFSATVKMTAATVLRVQSCQMLNAVNEGYSDLQISERKNNTVILMTDNQ